MSRGFDRLRTQEFEHTRVIIYHLAAANWDPKKPFPSIEEYWPLSSDEGQIKKKEDDLGALQARLQAKMKALFPHKFKA